MVLVLIQSLNDSDVVIFFDDICSGFKEFGKSPHDKISFGVLLIGKKALQHCLRDMCSASVGCCAILVCSLLD
jgi:hypothetical protein